MLVRGHNVGGVKLYHVLNGLALFMLGMVISLAFVGSANAIGYVWPEHGWILWAIGWPMVLTAAAWLIDTILQNAD